MLDKQFFKGVVAQLGTLSKDERDKRVDNLKKHLDTEMKKRNLKPKKSHNIPLTPIKDLHLLTI